MSRFMLHGLGDCTPDLHCGCAPARRAQVAPERWRMRVDHVATIATGVLVAFLFAFVLILAFAPSAS